MRSFFYAFLLIFLTICLSGSLQAQQADTLAPPPDEQVLSQDNEGVIELQEQEIKIIVEAPQVKLYSDRIKPDFDDVHLEKSFLKEITGDGEKLVFTQLREDPRERIIDIEQLLKKIR